MKAPLLILGLMALVVADPAPVAAAPVRTAKAACALVKARVSARDQFPVSAIAFCDMIPEASVPKEFYVLALHGKRSDCEGICSTNMGWFAVQKSTGRVFEWDMAEDKLGRAVTE